MNYDQLQTVYNLNGYCRCRGLWGGAGDIVGKLLSFLRDVHELTDFYCSSAIN